MSIAWRIILIIAACLAIAGGGGLGIRQSRRKREVLMAGERRDDSRGSYAFIINPSKPKAEATVAYIHEYCEKHGISDPIFIQTRLDKDGGVCAREALDRGARVVIACGGDGTVRTVARTMTGTGQPMGIIPIGTANIFARNVGVPLGNLEAALAVATSHGSRTVDVGYVQMLDSTTPDYKHRFLIVAGAGFDADMIGDANPELKKSLSWMAYFTGAFKHLFQPKAHGSVAFTDIDGFAHTQPDLEFRTIMAGNCGQIPAFSLMPEAEFDDGRLDFEIIDTSAGVIGWANLFGDVVHQTVVKKARQSPFSTNSTVEQFQGLDATLTLTRPQLVQVDGDILGHSRHIRFGIDRHSLLIRVPELPEGDMTAIIPPIRFEEDGDTLSRLHG